MISQGVLDKSRVEIKFGQYGVATATSLTDPSVLPRVQDYRRINGSRMYPVDATEIVKRVPTSDYHVSRKIDGEFTVLVYRDGEAFSINPGGTIRLGLPWHADAAEMLENSGVTEAMIAGELYVQTDENRRPRVHDVTKVARQPQSDADLNRLHFAVFDIISLNESPPPISFGETWQTILETFQHGNRVHPVESVAARDALAIEKVFSDWVDGQGAEGLVLRSDSAGVFKVKRRHTIDAAVIGFTESSDDRQGMMHDLLLAVMRDDGTLHVLSRVGGGFTEDQRRTMLSDLKDMVVESEYAEVNSDHVAYQMVRPEWVVEISCLDLISQTTRGGPVNRMVLNWNNQSSNPRYEVIRRLPLVSVISPQFVRCREDKSVQPTDVRIKQVSDLVDVPLVDLEAGQMSLPKGRVLRREVYTKVLKGETMVRKFLMWKTNKENESDEFPAYVVHYTDFSPNRKSPLARDVRVSNSVKQIESLWDGLVESNIKKGWELHLTADQADQDPRAEIESKAGGKPQADTTKSGPEVAEQIKPSKPKKKTAGKPEPTAKKSATKKNPTSKSGSSSGSAGLQQKAAKGKRAGSAPTGSARKTAAKQAPAKKAPTKKTPTKKAPTKKTPTKKTPAKKAPTKKTVAKKSSVKKPAAKRAAAKKKTRKKNS